jgi:hypothetical protein
MKTVIAALFITCVAAGCSKKGPAPDKPAGIAPSANPTTPPPTTPPPTAPAAAAPAAPSGGEAEMVPSPPDPGQSISGTIVVPASRAKDVQKGDTMFLIARRAGGPPGPGSMIAVQRLTAGDFPMPFTLSSRDAMIPGTPFEGSISINVRVDKDGDAITRRKGDVIGQASDVKVGTQNVTISLDTLQKEDVTLGGPMGGGMAGNKPPGHP